MSRSSTTRICIHSGGYGGYHGSSSGGHGSYYGGYRGYGCRYPSYGYISYGAYGYGYSPSYGDSFDYGYSGGSYPSDYAPTAPPSTAPAPAPAATPAVSPALSSLPVGKVDDFGYVHSPFTTSTFKVDTYAEGQTFYDPLTGQPFTVHKAGAVPKPAAPATTALPPGKVDEFGYVHSPYSTFTARVKSDPNAQVYQDPNTGQLFTVIPKIASKSVADRRRVVD